MCGHFSSSVWHGLGRKKASTKDLEKFSMTEDHTGEACLRVNARDGVQRKQKFCLCGFSPGQGITQDSIGNFAG